MKIALVVPGGVDRSGTDRVIPVLLALIRRLASRHELHVYALRQEDARGEWELCGAQIHNVGTGCTRWRALRAIRAEHRVAPFTLTQSFFSGSNGLIAVAAARSLGVPSLVHVSGGEVVAIRSIGYGGRLSWKGRLREALVLRAATVVTASSAPMVASLAALGIRAQCVPLGVGVDDWPCRSPSPRAIPGTARLVHVGSLNRVKDQSTLLQAFALLATSRPGVHLDIVGVDTLHGEIQALAKSLNIADQIAFHGYLTQVDLRPIMEAAHILVMSSRHEADPIVMLEAAMVGVPTVGTAVGRIAEWAPDAALVAPVGDARGLASLIESLLADDQLRLRVAAAAQRRAMAEDAGHTARCFELIYAALGGF